MPTRAFERKGPKAMPIWNRAQPYRKRTCASFIELLDELKEESLFQRQGEMSEPPGKPVIVVKIPLDGTPRE